MRVGRFSFWDSLFSGAMLNFQGVDFADLFGIYLSSNSHISGKILKTLMVGVVTVPSSWEGCLISFLGGV